MSARKSLPPDLGPDLLARYLSVYMQSRQMSDIERPWGLGDDALDDLWIRLTSALSGDPRRLNELIASALTDSDRERIVSTFAPLIFALPLRAYPAELRAMRSGEYIALVLRQADEIKPVGFLPVALAPSLNAYLREVLRIDASQRRAEAVISSGGRRRRVEVSLLANARGAVIRFLERLPSPAEEH